MSVPERSCPNCGFTLSVEAPICGNCGTQLSGPLATRLAPARVGRVIFLAVLAFGVGGFFLFREDAGRMLDAIQKEIAENVPPVAEPDSQPPRVPGYSRVDDLVADLRAGGLNCKRVRVDSSDAQLEAGSCQVRGTHVQINLYFDRQTIDFVATEIFDSQSPFTFVHADNWWVISTPKIVRSVRQILGGTVQRAAS